jgi:sterol desaturase/sphingolipid hydroxylase (fatty acid hydroxylase superfamily)
MLSSGTAPQAVIVIWFGLMPFIGTLERWMPRFSDWNRSKDDLLTDVIYFPTNLIFAGSLSALWAGLHLKLGIGLQAAVGSEVWPTVWPLAVQVIFACVLAEFFAYWPHRWMHENPFLWRFHSVHHSSRRVYWLNGVRAHPGEHVFRGFISSVPLAVAGAPPEVLAYWMVLTRIGGLFQHANIDFALGPFAWIFSIGELHRWHHSALREEADHNFGDTFIFWDALFGTRYLPDGEGAREDVGIGGLDAYPTTWWGQMAAPFRYSEIERESMDAADHRAL